MIFLDTYAIIEIIEGNPAYAALNFPTHVILSTLNLMELYYCSLRDKDEEKADSYYEFFKPWAVPVTEKDVKEACKFKLQHKSKHVSYIDCLGYVMALRRGAKFLTGDTA